MSYTRQFLDKLWERFPWETGKHYFFKVLFKLGFVVAGGSFVIGGILINTVGRSIDPLIMKLMGRIAIAWVVGTGIGILMIIVGFLGIMFTVPDKKNRD